MAGLPGFGETQVYNPMCYFTFWLKLLYSQHLTTDITCQLHCVKDYCVYALAPSECKIIIMQAVTIGKLT